MSKPDFAPERREVWYSDGPTGLYVVRVDKSVWPTAQATAGARCVSHRRFTVRLRARAAVRRARARISGRRISARRRGRVVRVRVNLKRFGRRPASLVVSARLRSGKVQTFRRAYRFCG
jgi:hypothetical protein